MVRAAALGTLVCLLVIGLQSKASAQIKEADTDFYEISFDEMSGYSLIDFITNVQRLTNIVIHYKAEELGNLQSGAAQPPGTMIWAVGTKRVPKPKLMEYFQAVLREYDFVAVRVGGIETGFWEVSKVGGTGGGKPGRLKSLAQIVSPSELEKLADNPGLLVTTSINLEFVDARETATSLTGYFADQLVESVRNIENSNALLMTGYASTLAGIQRLLKIIDQKPKNLEPQFLKRELKYAVADEVRPLLKDLVSAYRTGPQGRPGAPAPPQSGLNEPEPQILADARTNSLLIAGADATVKKINAWIDQLDVEVDPRGDTHVYRLRNSSAVKLADDLTKVIQGQQEVAARPGAGAAPGAGGGAATGGLEQKATIVAHEATNSIVITASRTKYGEILEIVKQLDVRPAQVLIEAALIEISSQLDQSLGIELQAVDADGRNPFGVTSFGLSTLLDQDGDGFQDTRVPNIGQGITGGIFDPGDFSFPIILSAVARDQNANVLSLPSILTNDNENATITSEDEVPTQQNTVNSSTGEAATSGFKDYQKAGIELQISPSISAGNYLRLHMQLKISSFSGQAENGLPPPKVTREVDTLVTLPDGHTMVIGGIILDDVRKTEQKVPILGDIPLIGFLFRNTSDGLRKVNLYVFMTPHIIRDDFASLDEMSFRHKEEARSLNGRVELMNRFAANKDDDPDARAQPADVEGLFEIPSYASPPGGEVDAKTAPKPEAGTKP